MFTVLKDFTTTNQRFRAGDMAPDGAFDPVAVAALVERGFIALGATVAPHQSGADAAAAPHHAGTKRRQRRQ